MRHPCATIADALESLAHIWSGDVPLPPMVTDDMDLNRVHAQGWRDSQVSTVASLHNWVRHLRKTAVHRWPWCDTCKLPVISTEGWGRLHSTPGSPMGLYPNQDKSGHEVTVKGWFDIPCSDLTT